MPLCLQPDLHYDILNFNEVRGLLPFRREPCYESDCDEIFLFLVITAWLTSMSKFVLNFSGVVLLQFLHTKVYLKI